MTEELSVDDNESESSSIAKLIVGAGFGINLVTLLAWHKRLLFK